MVICWVDSKAVTFQQLPFKSHLLPGNGYSHAGLVVGGRPLLFTSSHDLRQYQVRGLLKDQLVLLGCGEAKNQPLKQLRSRLKFALMKEKEHAFRVSADGRRLHFWYADVRPCGDCETPSMALRVKCLSFKLCL